MFAQYFGIPYRTVQDWYMGKRNMPDYLLRLMIYKIEMEKGKASACGPLPRNWYQIYRIYR